MLTKFNIKPRSEPITGIISEGVLPGLYQILCEILITRVGNDQGDHGMLKVNYVLNNDAGTLDDTIGETGGINDKGNHFSWSSVVSIKDGPVSFHLDPDQNLDNTDYSGTLRISLVGPL